MNKPGESWLKWEITPGHIVSWLISLSTIIALVVWLQADVRALQRSHDVIEKRIAQLESRTEQDRLSIADMRGDIRVIRQILENTRAAPERKVP